LTKHTKRELPCTQLSDKKKNLQRKTK